MNMYTKVGLTLILLAFLSSSLYAQQQVITGTVTDENTQEPIPGVNIAVQGTSIGTATDADGQYELEIPEKADTLLFSFIGYESQAIPIQGRSTINVKMISQTYEGDELVVVGYGEQSRETVTASVSRIGEEEFENAPAGNPIKQLQGKVPGLSLQVNAGQPGSAPQIFLRGGTSTGPPRDQPIFVIDGLVSQGQRGIEDLNPEDIKSVQVLKDAASTAIYGARGANGVIIIETKSGSKLAPLQVNVSYTHGIEEQPSRYDFLNAREYIYVSRLNTIKYNNENPSFFLEDGGFGFSTGNPRNSKNTTAFLDRYLEDHGPEYVNQLLVKEGWEIMDDPATGRKLIFKNTDFQDVTFQTAYKQEYDFNISGGSSRSTYYAGLGYMDREGIVYGTSYKNLSGIFKGTFDLSDRWSINTKLSYEFRNENNAESSTVRRSVKLPPTYRLRYENGLPAPGEGIASFRNRLHEVYYEDKYNDLDIHRTSLQGGVDWDISSNFHFSTSLYWFNTVGINSGFEARSEIVTNRPSRAANNFDSRLQLDGLLEYDKQFAGIHNVDAITGISYIDDYGFQFSASGSGAPTDYIPTLNATTTESQNARSTKSTDLLLSYFGRVNYDYDKRYLASVSFRIDGSSRFAEDHRWGFFPAASVGWNVHQEDFWPSTFVSRLKLRASWGQAGNNNLSISDSQGEYSTEYNYLGEVGILNTSLANYNLVWETTTTFDAGVDVGLFNNRLSVLLDYYNKLTEDRLINSPLRATSGFNSIRSNYGSIRNQGIELELSATPIQSQDFFWDLSFTFSFNRQKIVELPDNDEAKNRINGSTVYDSETGEYIRIGGFAEGERFGQRWAFDMIGVYATDEAAEDAPFDEIAGGREKVGGDAIWRDLDKNGVIDSRDMVFIGYIRPDKRGGMINTFSYKNLSLRMVMDYELGHVIDNGFRARGNGSARNNNAAFTDVLSDKIWRQQGDRASIPRYTIRSDYGYNLYNHVRPGFGIGNSGHASNSTLYYSKGDYLAFREVSLSYNLNADFLEKVSLQSLKFSAGVYNLGYITAYEGLNPEVYFGKDEGRYPRPRIFNFGVEASF